MRLITTSKTMGATCRAESTYLSGASEITCIFVFLSIKLSILYFVYLCLSVSLFYGVVSLCSTYDFKYPIVSFIL